MRPIRGIKRRELCLSLAALPCLLTSKTRAASSAHHGRGIYVNQTTLHDEEKLQGLIRLCSAFMVDTMVVDLWSRSEENDRAVDHIRSAGIAYVPRVQIFPGGGTKREVLRRDYWDKRWRSVDAALQLGARHIQLDFIRYDTNREADRQNAFDILKVLQFFSKRIKQQGATLEIDVFGDAAGGPSDVIGQDLRLMGKHVDGICPMVYPSHYEPHEETWSMPYQIAYTSVKNALKLLGGTRPSLVAYVEMFNVRHKMTDQQRAGYIRRQVQGATQAGAAGWYAWSSTNSYGLLFDLLAAHGQDFERVDDEVSISQMGLLHRPL